jgi:hypothetical protein
MGTAGVTKTMDDLVASHAVKNNTAAKIKDIAGKWQWMFRTTTPQEDWLNQSVVESFLKSCRDARSALLANR